MASEQSKARRLELVEAMRQEKRSHQKARLPKKRQHHQIFFEHHPVADSMAALEQLDHDVMVVNQAYNAVKNESLMLDREQK